MSYGMQITNADGRVQIDTDEIAPNTYISNTVASAYSAMEYPPSGFATGDLVLARPANSPSAFVGTSIPICKGQTINNQEHFYGSKYAQDSGYTYLFANTSGINTALLKTQAGNIAGPSAGELGLDVYSTDGSTILFSATRSTSVRVLAQGVLANGQEFNYTPSSSLNYNKIYVVVNSSILYVQPANSFFPSWVVAMLYYFYPNATSPYIRVSNKTTSNGSLVSTTALFPYLIVYDTN